MTRNALARIARRPAQVMALVVCTVMVVVVVLGWQFAGEGLRISVQESTEASNRTLTRVFVNETWDRVKPLLPPPGSSAEAAKANPNIAAVDQIVRRFSSYTDVLKVKIYDRGGITVYSSDRAQIGEDKSRNAGFQAAARGEVASEMTYRGKFGAFDGELYDRNLVSTYVPLRVGDRIEGVLEIYADRTASIEFVNRELRGLAFEMVPWVLVALVLVAVIAGWLHRTQLEAARELARAEAQARERAQQALAAAAAAPALPQALPESLTALEPVLAEVRRAVAAAPPTPEWAEAWATLLNRAESIAGWARCEQDMRRLDAGTSAAPRPFDADAQLDDALAGPTARAQAAGSRLQVFRHPQPLGAVNGDAELMDAVLNHLVGASLDLASGVMNGVANGVMSGVTNGVTVQCKVLLDDAGLHVDVLDDGPGLEPSQLDAWFTAWDDSERWPQPDGAGAAGRRLVLVRALLARAGGRFDARGTPGHGNRWSAVLPCAGVVPASPAGSVSTARVPP